MVPHGQFDRGEPQRIKGVLPYDSRLTLFMYEWKVGRTLTDPLDLVRVSTPIKMTSGKGETVAGLIDGPVFKDHPDFAIEKIDEILGTTRLPLAASSQVQRDPRRPGSKRASTRELSNKTAWPNTKRITVSERRATPN